MRQPSKRETEHQAAASLPCLMFSLPRPVRASYFDFVSLAFPMPPTGLVHERENGEFVIGCEQGAFPSRPLI